MKQHSEQQLDKFAEKLMKSAGLEKPAEDFTENIMAGIKGVQISEPVRYKALISKQAWAIIGMVFTGLLVYVTYFQPSRPAWLNDNNLLKGLIESDVLNSINLSETLIFSLVLFGLMFILQIGLMKSYFNKRLQY